MKDTKRRLEVFSFYDRAHIERHLEAMAARGWLLERMGNSAGSTGGSSRSG